MNIQILKDAGVDIDDVMKRFMNDTGFYEMVLGSFLKDTVFERAQNAYINGDTQELIRAVHDAKGSCGNMGFTDIFNNANAILGLLRNTEQAYTKEELFKAFSDFETAYKKMVTAVTAAIS